MDPIEREPYSKITDKISNEEVINQMIIMAAEMVTLQNMPSIFIEDWELPKNTPKSVITKILKISEKAEKQSKDWAHELKNLISYLRK